ncbi:MAG TPA: hypothetical protein DIW20_03505, partial [Rhodospirillaceae bacterium]|nr:hypothetical protein [Rhodospirillaceae bacterium]
MSESPKRPAPPKDAAPAGEAAQKNAIHKLRATLETSLADGNLTRARAHLRMTSPVTARAAVMALGAPYVKALQTAPHVTLDGKQGAAAAKQFIDEELRPLVTREARKAASPRKDFNAQKNKNVPPKNSLLKRLWRGTAMGALLLGLSTSMVIETAAPARSDIHADAAVVTESIRTDVSALRTEFGKTSLGRDMLALADKHNISIVYDDALSGTNTLGSYNAGTKTLRMNPTQTLAEQVMIMSHELRHAWQDVVLGYGEMENRLLTPQQQWTLRRYLEEIGRA